MARLSPIWALMMATFDQMPFLGEHCPPPRPAPLRCWAILEVAPICLDRVVHFLIAGFTISPRPAARTACPLRFRQ